MVKQILLLVFLISRGYTLNCIYENVGGSNVNNGTKRRIECSNIFDSSCQYTGITTFTGKCTKVKRKTECIDNKFSRVCTCNSNKCNDPEKSPITNSSMGPLLLLCYQYRVSTNKRLVRCNGSCMKTTTKDLKRGCSSPVSSGCRFRRLDINSMTKVCHCSTDYCNMNNEIYNAIAGRLQIPSSSPSEELFTSIDRRDKVLESITSVATAPTTRNIFYIIIMCIYICF